MTSKKQAVITAELREEVANCTLEVVGKIPDWLTGTLIRNGPITVTVDEKSNDHWFDGLAMLHAFSFQEGTVKYSNKFLRTDAYRAVFERGSLNYDGFAIDPCRALFKRFFSLFMPSSQLAVHNANVNVAKLENVYVALTETPLPVQFDLETLETLGVFDYQDALPKDKCWESAHPHYDLQRKEMLNYLIKYGKRSYYTFYRMQEGSKERKIIAEIPVEQPAYMHSFAMTENFVILTEFPLVVKPLDLLIKGQAFIKNFSWQPQRGTKFIVLNRHTGKIVTESITRPFFAFHHANAFEKDHELHFDIVTYENAHIITGKGFYISSDNAVDENCHSRLERFSLSLSTGKITSTVLLSHTNEFPRINEAFDGHPYTYLYSAGFTDEAKKRDDLLNAQALYKVNTTTKEVLKWEEKGCSPGEPVFVSSPHAKEEDDGVILAVVLDRSHHYSFLLILDARSFKEIARAKAPHVIPAGLHGQHFHR